MSSASGCSPLDSPVDQNNVTHNSRQQHAARRTLRPRNTRLVGEGYVTPSYAIIGSSTAVSTTDANHGCADHRRLHYKARVAVENTEVDVEALDRYVGWYALHRNSPHIQIDISSRVNSHLLTKKRVRYRTGWPLAYQFQTDRAASQLDNEIMRFFLRRAAMDPSQESLLERDYQQDYHEWLAQHLQDPLFAAMGDNIRLRIHSRPEIDFMHDGVQKHVETDFMITNDPISLEGIRCRTVLLLVELKTSVSFEHHHLSQLIGQLMALRQSDLQAGLVKPVYYGLALFRFTARVLEWRPNLNVNTLDAAWSAQPTVRAGEIGGRNESHDSTQARGVVTVSPPMDLLTSTGNDQLIRCIAAITSVGCGLINDLERHLPPIDNWVPDDVCSIDSPELQRYLLPVADSNSNSTDSGNSDSDYNPSDGSSDDSSDGSSNRFQLGTRTSLDPAQDQNDDDVWDGSPGVESRTIAQESLMTEERTKEKTQKRRRSRKAKVENDMDLAVPLSQFSLSANPDDRPSSSSSVATIDASPSLRHESSHCKVLPLLGSAAVDVMSSESPRKVRFSAAQNIPEELIRQALFAPSFYEHEITKNIAGARRLGRYLF
ncbi:hypothetical protein PYCC9005_002867 [Savitreella phatthalungensis]